MPWYRNFANREIIQLIKYTLPDWGFILQWRLRNTFCSHMLIWIKTELHLFHYMYTININMIISHEEMYELMALVPTSIIHIYIYIKSFPLKRLPLWYTIIIWFQFDDNIFLAGIALSCTSCGEVCFSLKMQIQDLCQNKILLRCKCMGTYKIVYKNCFSYVNLCEIGIAICSSNQPWYDLSRYLQNNSYHDISGPA